MGKTIIADLPPMTAADYKEFEETVHPWGTQRSIRRRQVQVAAAGGVAGAVAGWVWPVAMRRNTKLVGYLMTGTFAIGGATVGHFVGTQIFPSVTSNSQTTLMRRLWWAKKVSADWKYDLPEDFAAKYPNVDVSKFQ